jgi:hypothetical protein
VIARYRVAVVTADGARELVADLCPEHAGIAQQCGALLNSDEGPVSGRIISLRTVSDGDGICVVCSGRVRLS